MGILMNVVCLDTSRFYYFLLLLQKIWLKKKGHHHILTTFCYSGSSWDQWAWNLPQQLMALHLHFNLFNSAKYVLDFFLNICLAKLWLATLHLWAKRKHNNIQNDIIYNLLFSVKTLKLYFRKSYYFLLFRKNYYGIHWTPNSNHCLAD